MWNTAPSADDYKAHVVKTLGKIRDEEARETLNRAARQVQPLMRRRQWKVGVLLEFYPKSDCLLGLNVNHGQQVKVRLRPPGSESDFYPYEHILGTLLHELTHIEVSPHNAAFYKLLDEITQECEDDIAKGISGTGVGFDANSMGRLGGRVYDHNPDPARLRQVMAEAASKRWQQNALMPSGGTRLGGNTSVSRHLSPAQAAAQAAERRQRDDLWCGIEVQEQEPPEKVMASNPRRDSASLKENTRNVGGQRGLLHPHHARPEADVKGKGELRIECACCASGPSRTCRRAEVKQSGNAEQAPIDLTISEDEDDLEILSDQSSSRDGGMASSVTGLSKAATSASIPSDIDSTRVQKRPRQAEARNGWQCERCTLLNQKSSTHCDVCGTWRYSHGPPAIFRPTR